VENLMSFLLTKISQRAAAVFKSFFDRKGYILLLLLWIENTKSLLLRFVESLL